MQRADILDKLNAGDPGAALAMLRRLLDAHPDDPDLLGLLGIALEETGDAAGAETALRRALARHGETAIRLRNAANLVGLLVETGKRPEAETLLKQGWRWSGDLDLGPREFSAIAYLANAMVLLELDEQAVAFLLPLADCTELNWATLKPLATALARTGKTAQALDLLEAAMPDDVVDHERQALLAFLYRACDRREPAVRARTAFVAGAPPLILPETASQKYRVGMVQNNPHWRSLISPPALQHFSSNYPGMMARRQAEEFRFASLFLGAGAASVREFREFRPRVIINNVVNAEILRSTDNVARVNTVLAEFDVPVINRPEQAAQCTRQMNPHTLAGIPGVAAPWIRRYLNDPAHVDELAVAVEQECSYPFIVRSTTEQEARNMVLVDGREAFATLLGKMPRGQFYVIQYLGEQRRAKYFRRIRAAFIDGVPLIVRADYADGWIVRSRNKIPLEFYRTRPDLLAEADAIIAMPEQELGGRAMRTLDAIGQALPLDIFGMDFDVDDDGKVIFFEANASMNFFSNAPDEFPYPPQAERMLSERIGAALDKRVEASR